MRVIAGKYRHRKLLAPPGELTRPILDRVKVSLFDWLGSRLALPGQLPPISVLDLFCGAGTLGIEALSRGARYCAFVDSDPLAIDCLSRNLDTLRIGPQARVYSRAAQNVRATGPHGEGFDLIFFDPPYRLSEDLSPGAAVQKIIKRLGRELPVSQNAILIWRHDAACELPESLQGEWRSAERRDWGNMAITLFERRAEVPD